jgi:predicted  nucleic acid-binding Zn-ribbon protein
MNPQLQMLVILQNMDEMIGEFENHREELEGLGFKHEGIDKLRSDREELMAKVDPRFLSLYKRLKDKHDQAVVPVRQNLCTGCFANIPAIFVSKVNVNRLQKCESCGRILYWP